jgi:hypothetical protein
VSFLHNFSSHKGNLPVSKHQTCSKTGAFNEQSPVFLLQRVFQKSGDVAKLQQVQLFLHRARTMSGVSWFWFSIPCGDCKSYAGFCLFIVYCLTQLEPKESTAKARAYLSAESIVFDVSGHFCNTQPLPWAPAALQALLTWKYKTLKWYLLHTALPLRRRDGGVFWQLAVHLVFDVWQKSTMG